MKPFPLLVAIGLLAAGGACAQPTHVMIRAQSLDAKFIGTHTGGVRITLTNARTGAVLARGLITGGTGDTPRIMKTPHERGAPLAIGDTAGFDAVLDLKAPTLVRAEAEGPMGRPASVIHVSSSLWVIPGHDIGGDGWVLNFPGLVIEPTATPAPDGAIRIGAKITMMCGCPIEPGGVWDAANYTVVATLKRGGRVVGSVPLTYAGHSSQFAGTLPGVGPGRYRLQVVATDARTPNSGVVEQAVSITKPRT